MRTDSQVHAVRRDAAGFCVDKAAAPGGAAFLRAGVGKVAYVAVDARHGDAQENCR